MIGTNNTGHLQRPADETFTGIRAVIDEFRKHQPDVPLVLCSIFPRGERPDDSLRSINDGINSRIKGLADGRRTIYLDLAPSFINAGGIISREIMPDFLHLSPAGYERWAKGLEPVLKKMGM